LRGITRGRFLALAAGGAMTIAAGARAQTPGSGRMETRPIPSSGERLPVVGLGTWRGFDVGADAAARAPLRGVVDALLAAGGSVIDSSPMYGAAEAVVGDLLADMNARERAFIATKVWTTGRAAGVTQMQASLRKLRSERVELMQIHNLQDWRTHLATLRAWKAEGRIRYLGITHYTPGAHDDLAAVMRSEPLDFVQLNYALDDRAAERRVLPLAAERGIAVVVNMPFGGGGLLRRLSGRPLPPFAGELGCTSWAQLLLKFVLGHPAVTVVIPGTSRAAHMRDNAAAGALPFPDAAMRTRMEAAI